MASGKRLTQEEVEKRAEEHGLKLLGIYKGNKTKCLFECRCGKTFMVRPNSIFAGATKSCGCAKSLTQEEAKRRAEERGFKLIGEHKGSKIKCLFECGCGRTFLSTFCNVTSGNIKSCGHCKDPKIGDRFDGLEVVEVIRGNRGGCQVIIKCNCGKIFGPKKGNALTNYAIKSCGCSVSSKAEKIIKNIMKDKQAAFIREKSFDGLMGKGRGKLRFDFYLTDLNSCIEYQGEQHYEQVKNWGGKEHLLYIQEHDRRKVEYCKANKINLFCIPYTIEEENIETIIEEIISGEYSDLTKGLKVV